MKPILFIFSGLPATGESTLAKLVAKEYNAVYLRIDTIEQGLRDLCNFNVQGEGYRLSYRITSDNLKLDRNVVSDSCNPIYLTREEWEEVAKENNSLFINIEMICSNKKTHRNRVEARKSEVENLKLPTWEEIENREYHSWESGRIIIETENQSIEESFSELKGKIEQYLKIYYEKRIENKRIMKAENQIQLLRDPQIEPTDIVLEKILGKDVFDVYQQLVDSITNEFDIQYEWRYYKDGKAWLFKAVYKKKTIFWLSIWDRYLQTSFFFTEKTRSGISDLSINKRNKDNFEKAETIGKLIPLILYIDTKEQLNDFREIVKYKKSLK